MLGSRVGLTSAPAIEQDPEYGAYGEHLIYVLGWIGVVLLSLFGALAGGAGGWVVGMGHSDVETSAATICGALIGFVLFGCIGFLFLGPGTRLKHRVQKLAPPDPDRVAITGMQSFDLFVTVHRVDGARSPDIISGLFGVVRQPDSYVLAQCGRLVDDDTFMRGKNPSKRTCINSGAVFEEAFSFVVGPTDEVLEFILYDQDMMGEDSVGMCCINITKDILEAGFPQRHGYKLHADPPLSFFRGEHDQIPPEQTERRCGNLILSFRPGNNFPRSAKHVIVQGSLNAALSYEEMGTTHHPHPAKGNNTKGQAGDYGTWATSQHAAHAVRAG